MSLDKSFRELQWRVVPLEKVVELFASSLDEPIIYEHSTDRGFRYRSPDIRHLCLLKAVRAVSALNASFELAKWGYTQEIAVLIRILIECCKHIEYVLDIDESEVHRANVQKYVREFFEDARRDPEAEIKGVLIREKVINEQLGKTLDRIAKQYGDVEGRVPAGQLYWKGSRAFSLYVHARYPECMDLYGGRPGRFHLQGMSGTPKDYENLETLETLVGTATTAFVIMVQGTQQLRELVMRDEVLGNWYSEHVRG